MPDRFTPQSVLRSLQHICQLAGIRPRRLLVGLSGGADSTALLWALQQTRATLPGRLQAVHVNHGVSNDADRWQQHCEQLCQDLKVPLDVLQVTPDPQSARGPEGEWRHCRYSALAAFMRSGDAFLTAHHRQDQAETVLLKLMRGQGLAGQAGMPLWRPLGQGFLLRPLLDFCGNDLRAQLRSVQQTWLEDPSNKAIELDRAYIRHQVLPLLQQRWPAASSLLARSAGLAREALEVSETLCSLGLKQAVGTHGQLCLDSLPDPQGSLLRAYLRRWLHEQGLQALPTARLTEFCRQLEQAGPDSRVELHWDQHRLRLFHQQVWLLAGQAEPPLASQQWRGPETIDLGPVAGTLQMDLCGDTFSPLSLHVQARQGGETLKQDARTLTIKDWMRSQGLPPWLRDQVPLVHDDQCLLAVGDCLISSTFSRWLEGHDAQLRWQPVDPILCHWRNRIHKQRKAVETTQRLG